MEPEDLRLLLDEQRSAEAAGRRARERWLLRQAEEEHQLAGVLATLRDRGWAANIRTIGGHAHQGRVAAVGIDFCSLRTRDLAVYCPFAGIVSIRPDPAAAEAPADPDPLLAGLTFAEALAGLAEQRPRVQIALAGPAEPLAGLLVGVGIDLLTLAADEGPTAPCYVPLSSVADLSVRVSG